MRADHDPQALIGPQADFVAGQTDDAGIAGAEHLDGHALAEAKFVQVMNVFGLA